MRKTLMMCHSRRTTTEISQKPLLVQVEKENVYTRIIKILKLESSYYTPQTQIVTYVKKAPAKEKTHRVDPPSK